MLLKEAKNLGLTPSDIGIDTARLYGNENKTKGFRNYHITTKIIKQGSEGFSKELQKSLKTFDGTIDLVLLHYPMHSTEWKILENAHENGSVKQIGVSNHTVKDLKKMKRYHRVKPVVNQIEFHPFINQDETLEYCKKEGIVVQGHSHFCKTSVFQNKILLEMASKYQKTVPQILLRYVIQKGVQVCFKTSDVDHFRENIGAFSFEMSFDDILKLETLRKDPLQLYKPKFLTPELQYSSSQDVSEFAQDVYKVIMEDYEKMMTDRLQRTSFMSTVLSTDTEKYPENVISNCFSQRDLSYPKIMSEIKFYIGMTVLKRKLVKNIQKDISVY
jgi:diketogulonate reductase-like aldo/keto reductase